MKQLTLFGDTVKDSIETLIEQYKKLQLCLNTNKSLLMAPMEFILNRPPGIRTSIFTNDGCILYENNSPYIVIGKEAIETVDSAKLAIEKPESCFYKAKKEYIYDLNLLSTFRTNKKLYNIKRMYNKSKKLGLTIEISSDIKPMYEIYKEWKITEGKKYFQIHDTVLHKNFVKYWDKIKDKLLLVYLKDGNKYCGFIMFERTDKDFIYLMSRKVLSQYISNTVFFQLKIFKKLYKEYNCNFISDGGASKKGLQFYKEKFRPIVIKTYSFTKK